VTSLERLKLETCAICQREAATIGPYAEYSHALRTGSHS